MERGEEVRMRIGKEEIRLLSMNKEEEREREKERKKKRERCGRVSVGRR